MIVTDPIADMLTRIRNAINAKHESVLIPASKEKLAIAEILLEEGYISSFEFESAGAFKNIKVVIKYDADNQSVIQGIKRISKPGLRIYCTVDKIPQVINGLGIAILSTNKGIMTDKKARAQKVGGEVLCYVW